nr:hypothetical protein [Tanacetum cinerariifolium]
VRQVVRPYIWFRVGNGSKASAWFDNWCSLIPLLDVISNRDIYGVGFHLSAKVKDISVNDSWGWLDAWLSKYNELGTIGVSQLSNASDRLVWRDSSNAESGFSVATVWNCIRLRCIEVWEHLKRFTGISNIPPERDAIVDYLSPLAKMRSARSVITKLVFAASCYFNLQERNNRLFMKKKRSQDKVIDIIKSTVRLKLLTCRFKKTSNVQMLFDEVFWVRDLEDGLKVECSPIALLFFHSSRALLIGEIDGSIPTGCTLIVPLKKFNHEKEKNEKLTELKAWLNFEGCSRTSRYSQSKTMNTKEHRKRHRSRRSRSPRTSVFSRIRRERSRSPIKRERSRSPRQRAKEGGVFKRSGSRGKSVSARSDSYDQHSYSSYTEALSESEDSGDGHWKSRSKKKKTSGAEDDLSQPWVCEETDPFRPRIRYFDFPKTRMPSHIKTYDGSEDP